MLSLISSLIMLLSLLLLVSIILLFLVALSIAPFFVIWYIFCSLFNFQFNIEMVIGFWLIFLFGKCLSYIK